MASTWDRRKRRDVELHVMSLTTGPSDLYMGFLARRVRYCGDEEGVVPGMTCRDIRSEITLLFKPGDGERLIQGLKRAPARPKLAAEHDAYTEILAQSVELDGPGHSLLQSLLGDVGDCVAPPRCCRLACHGVGVPSMARPPPARAEVGKKKAAPSRSPGRRACVRNLWQCSARQPGGVRKAAAGPQFESHGGAAVGTDSPDDAKLGYSGSGQRTRAKALDTPYSRMEERRGASLLRRGPRLGAG